MPRWIRKTTDNKITGGVRLFLGVLFVMAGAMKLAVPMLADAWSGQLLAAGLPFYALTRWTVPFVEIAVGGILLWGGFARIASAVVVAIMVVATYVHPKKGQKTCHVSQTRSHSSPVEEPALVER